MHCPSDDLATGDILSRFFLRPLVETKLSSCFVSLSLSKLWFEVFVKEDSGRLERVKVGLFHSTVLYCGVRCRDGGPVDRLTGLGL